MDNPWLERRVIAYAHQGGAWEWPSSTLFAIANALDAGATGIELDVHATADRHLVVSHDATVDRTTDSRGDIASLTLAQLRGLDASFWFIPGADVTPGRPAEAYPWRGRAPAERAYGVATLDEVFELVGARPGVVLNLDIKQTAPAVAPYEELLARAIDEHGLAERVIVASFLDPATEAFRLIAPEVATSAGTLGTAEFWRALHAGEVPAGVFFQALQVPATHGDIVVVDETLVAGAHGAGVAVHVWTVNDPVQMARLVDLGVDGVITDLPTQLVEVLEARGVAWRPA